MTTLRTPHQSGRVGSTLTEVLMALLIMGVGLTSVVSLFPVSLLRSVEATKLTSATLLRQNAEAMIRSIPSVAGATIIDRGIIEDPNANGLRGYEDPYQLGNFIFDPLGAVVSAGNTAPPIGVNPTLPTYNVTTFGDFDGDGQSDPLGPDVLKRFTFGLNTIDPAEEFVTLPDSFVTLADAFIGTPSHVTDTSVRVLGVDFSEYAADQLRVTALHTDGLHSAIRNVESISGDSLVLDSDISAAVAGRDDLKPDNSLPAGYAGSVGRVIVELPERRYTWIATVRRPTFRSSLSVTIAVFFRRSFSPEDEKVYLCGEPAGSYNEFTLNPADNGGAVPPGLERGGWMFDMNSFRWWKIASVQETSTGLFRIGVDPEELDPSAAARGPSTPNGPVYAIFPQNVVEAYTLKKDH